MDTSSLQAMFRFNTWANEQIRQAMLGADEELIHRRLELWYGSVFEILAHVSAAAAHWLARLQPQEGAEAHSERGNPSDVRTLVDVWRSVDGRWEAYVVSLSPEELAAPVFVRRRDGSSMSYLAWQPIMQIAFHSTEHRGHATVGLSQLGIRHGPQDFLDQFRRVAPIESRPA
jgi:uncharacterized damage-inducible protein DinB